MLLWTLGASLLENLLTGKSLIKAGEETIRVGKMFWSQSILYLISKYKIIMKMNLNSMAFIQVIIYQK